jgi:unsaturated rhamnogalacturonyl hydrolase
MLFFEDVRIKARASFRRIPRSSSSRNAIRARKRIGRQHWSASIVHAAIRRSSNGVAYLLRANKALWGRAYLQAFQRVDCFGIQSYKRPGKFIEGSNMSYRAKTGVSVLLLIGATSLFGQQDVFRNWPEGTSPQEIGRRLSEHFVTSPHQYTPTLFYAEAATWYGALTFSQLTHDDALRAELIKKFEPLMPGGSEDARIPVRHHVDDSIFGIVPLEIGMETKDPKYLAYGRSWADRQWENPQPDGLSGETRYWIDDMYMLTILQLEAYRTTRERKYLDRDALEMVTYLDKLQQPNGLFYHAVEVPLFWARGNGWGAAGMAEILRDLPPDHPQRARILKGYRAMMAALLKYQGKDGMWRELIDNDKAWPESSGSAMFSFAMITGVKNGWLDAKIYGPAARRSWIAVAGYVDQNADVTSVCEGTSKKNDAEYYLERKRRTGDFHGQAPVLWTASALLR